MNLSERDKKHNWHPYTQHKTAADFPAIIKGKDIPEPGIPEAYKVLQHELQALAINVKILDVDGNEIDMKKVEQDEIKEEAIVIADMSMINDIEGLSIIDEEDEVPEAAEIGFDDLDMD